MTTMRQSTETMCEENLLLVNAVKKFSCLYNFSVPEYMKKEETDAAWVEIASSMRQTVHECKEKWRNLRYSFLRSMKPNRDGSSKKRYYLHKEMEFLVPFMKTRFEAVVAPNYEDDSDDETISNFMNMGEDPIVTEEPATNLDYCTFELPSTEPLIKRKKTTHRSTRDNGNYECPRKMFLLGLLPEINSLNEVQMKAFRRKVFTLIDEITENDDPINNTGDNNLHENNRRSSQISKKAENAKDREFITTIKAEPL